MFDVTRESVRTGVPAEVTTPFIVYDIQKVLSNYHRFTEALPSVPCFYAIKSNSNPAILRSLILAGCRFEIASVQELDLLRVMGVVGGSVVYSNPMKKTQDIRHAVQKGVTLYSVDSFGELEKLANFPCVRGLVRIAVENDGSDWPLSKKFGVSLSKAEDLIAYASRIEANLAGVCFHVGSQNRTLLSWSKAIQEVMLLEPVFKKHGFTLDICNIGGGFPIDHGKPYYSIEAIGEAIEAEVAKHPEVTFMAEPGRYMTGDAGDMVARVVGSARREDGVWVTIDAGVFHGLAETIDSFNYELEFYRGSTKLVPTITATIAGPTCDSVDVVFKNKQVPEGLVEGDLVIIRNAGAYTKVYSSSFNGFPPPEVYVKGIYATAG